MGILDKILRVGEGRVVKKLEKLADYVVSLEDDYADMTDDELRTNIRVQTTLARWRNLG